MNGTEHIFDLNLFVYFLFLTIMNAFVGDICCLSLVFTANKEGSLKKTTRRRGRLQPAAAARKYECVNELCVCVYVYVSVHICLCLHIVMHRHQE